MPRHHQHVALGGSFDHFHLGHQALLEAAFSAGKFVTIGVTSDKFVRSKTLASAIEPYSARLAQLERYLKSQGWLSRTTLTQLTRSEGSTLHSRTITALITSPKTKTNAYQINQKRRALKLSPFQIIAAPLIKSTDRRHLSSTRIRLGQVLPNGYLTIDYFPKPILLTDQDKSTLRRITWGPSFSSPAKLIDYLSHQSPPLIIAVGDQTTSSLVSSRLQPSICLIDNQINRQPTDLTKHLEPTISVRNPAGEIKPRLASAIRQIVHHLLVGYLNHRRSNKTKNKPVIIKIRGEEDLAAVPACLLAPLNAVVIFGYKDRLIAVTPNLKTKYKLINKLNLIPAEPK